MHSICSFANDFNNWSGGYIFIGIAEENKRPVLPPKGIEQREADRIQQDLRGLCRKLDPHYFPLIQPEIVDDKLVLIIWVPTGDQRPYSAPVSISKSRSERAYYIRENSSSIKARRNKLTELLQMAKKISYDNRINQNAKLKELDLGLIREHLQKIGSKLFDESASMDFADLCKKMKIVGGPPEHLRPLNIGLMLFTPNPESWFERARIEIVVHNPTKKREFEEKTFDGPVQYQLLEAFDFLKISILRHKTIKVTDRAQSKKIWNFPFDALEEALSNAVYHKDYSVPKSIEVQVWPNKKITILSYPGPLPPIGNRELQNRTVIARDYRNPKLGDFLKELNLTEGRATGIPLIDDSMSDNGSPPATLQTDDDRTYFLVELNVHEEFEHEPVYVIVDTDKFQSWQDVEAYIEKVSNQVSNQISDQDGVQVSAQVGVQVSAQVSAQVDAQVSARVHDLFMRIVASVENTIKIIDSIAKNPLSREKVLANLNLSNHRKNYLRYMEPLIKSGFMDFAIPSKPTSRNQKYQITIKGLIFREILKQSHTTDRK